MIDSQIRALFAQIADGEPVPSRVDVEFARRRGRARLRWRRACVAGARWWPRPRSRPWPWGWARSGPVLARRPPGPLRRASSTR